LGASPLNYTGNKACIAPYLLDIMDDHTGYLEVFCGSAELLLRKEPCGFELLNDYNGDVTHLWRVTQSRNLAQLIGSVFLSLGSEEIFRENRELLRGRPNILDEYCEAALEIAEYPWPEVQAAAALLETQFYSFSSTGTSFALRGKDILPKLRRLVAAHTRLRQAVIVHRDYRDAVRQFAAPGFLVYMDPPYVTTENCYRKSCFGHDSHVELFRFAHEEIHVKFGGQCKLIITYNDCPLVRELAKQHGFYLYTQDRLHNMAQHADPGSLFTEVIITNYDVIEVMNRKAFLRSREMDQLSMFDEGRFR
jgi:DNA adenine methylase